MAITMICGFSTMQLGAALSGSTVAFQDLRFIILPGYDIMDPKQMELILRDNSMISAASIVGVALGGLIGGEFITSFGRRKVILVSNGFMVLFSLISIIPSFLIIVIARFFFGMSVGFVLTAAPKIVVETVPSNLLGYGFGSFTNLSTFFFVIINIALGLLNGSVMMQKDDGYVWYLAYLIPIPFSIAAIIGFMTIYKIDSPTH